MRCRECHSELEKPGDYCLVCRSANADSVVCEIDRDRVTLTMLNGEDVLGETTITTVPESGDPAEVVERRNFAGRVADEIQRKRPQEVYAAGDREVLAEIRAQLHYDFYRVTDADDDPVEAVRGRIGEPALATVDTPPEGKIGGSHSTLIGGRTGMKVIHHVAGHPHVKKVIPGPIDAGGSGSRSGLRAKATRAGANGNVRLLLRDGSSVQENRVVTTAPDRETGERVRADLNELLDEEGFGVD
ncbi:hypothetical protein HAPAU_01390 [Halalkalicoccus paucihalophilus]|uniref:Metal-binding protein n=1 Tax=Halalkalicoccus paucihalophilus TaxID=1008153 RepID=A0A151AIK1_9EURY|nr:DUF2103 domain-containing protein [Halalkalicoccus paucihalophilus]KYH27471.1 hypothetical protein HAPAU_01390 [Halalkalicoccus paucihalophilus]